MLKLRSAQTKLESKATARQKGVGQKGTSSRTRKFAATNDVQTLVTIAGVEAKVGTTHLALSLALKASQRGISCAVIIPHTSFEALKQYYVLSVREDKSGGQGGEPRQFATFAGLNITAGILPGDLEGFQLVVWDCGSLPLGQRRFSSGDLCCLLSGGQAWELTPLNELLMKLTYEELSRYLVCIRAVPESDFDHIVEQMAGKLPCVHLLHKTNWSDVVLREDLIAILRHAQCS